MRPTIRLLWGMRLDKKAIRAIDHAAYQTPLTDDEHNRFLDTPESICMIAKHKGKIVGFVYYQLHKQRLWVERLAVHPRHQRKGIGRKILRRLVEKLAGTERSRVCIWEKNLNEPHALRFIKSAAAHHGVYDRRITLSW